MKLREMKEQDLTPCRSSVKLFLDDLNELTNTISDGAESLTCCVTLGNSHVLSGL